MKLLNTEEAARLLKYKSVSRIRTLMREEKIHAIKVGKTWVIAEEELQKYTRKRKQYKRKAS